MKNSTFNRLNNSLKNYKQKQITAIFLSVTLAISLSACNEESITEATTVESAETLAKINPTDLAQYQTTFQV